MKLKKKNKNKNKNKTKDEERSVLIVDAHFGKRAK